MTIWIDNETRLRVNINHTYKGFSALNTPEIREIAGVVEVPEPAKPEDYSEDLYYCTEQDATPYVVYTRKSPDQVLAIRISRCEKGLDAHLDEAAQSRRYNDRFTFALRAGYAGPFQAEAVAFAAWMDACNLQAFAALQEIVTGKRPMPTEAEFIAALPTFGYPAGA